MLRMMRRWGLRGSTRCSGSGSVVLVRLQPLHEEQSVVLIDVAAAFQIRGYGRKVLETVPEARVMIEWWREHCNAERPQASLGYRPPAPETISAGRLKAEGGSAAAYRQRNIHTDFGLFTGERSRAYSSMWHQPRSSSTGTQGSITRYMTWSPSRRLPTTPTSARRCN